MSAAATSIEAAAHYQRAADHFAKAIDHAGEVLQFRLIGGQPVRIRYAGEKLARSFSPAIDHLSCKSAAFLEAGTLSIDVWESSDSPIELTESEWLYCASPLETLGPHDFVYCQPDIGKLVLFRAGRALICYRNTSEIPPWELAIPFRVVLNSWFQRTGGQIIHAAAIANKDHAVILAGSGGAGKSSTALSCLNHPALYFLADDLCLLQCESFLTVSSLYNSIKIRRENLFRFSDMNLPHLGHLPLDQGKPTYFLYPRYQHQLAQQRPVKAILLPRITSRAHTLISPAAQSDAWRALVPSTFAVVMGNRQAAATNIRQLTRATPAYWLELGTDREQIIAAINEFLGGSGQGD